LKQKHKNEAEKSKSSNEVKQETANKHKKNTALNDELEKQ
jgi:hypothetical protein